VAAENPERVTLARIVRPHGLRGEVAAEILTDFPERLTKLRKVWLWNGGASEPLPAKVKRCRLTTSRGGQAIFHFDGIDSVERAGKLRGVEVQVPIGERAKIPAHTYFVTDLIGCEVWEQGASVPIGTVKDVMRGGTPVLEITTPAGELLVPLAQEICTKIDPKHRRIEVRLPEGLRQLNQG
jgi:16S rRNA processing protein RimM